jgi:hypothetical protein
MRRITTTFGARLGRTDLPASGVGDDRDTVAGTQPMLGSREKLEQLRSPRPRRGRRPAVADEVLGASDQLVVLLQGVGRIEQIHATGDGPEEGRVLHRHRIRGHPEEERHAVAGLANVDGLPLPETKPIPILGGHGVESRCGVCVDGVVEGAGDLAVVGVFRHGCTHGTSAGSESAAAMYACSDLSERSSRSQGGIISTGEKVLLSSTKTEYAR